MEAPDDVSVPLSVDCGSLTIDLEPVWSQKAMFSVEGDEGGHFLAFQLLLYNFFRWRGAPKNVIVIVYSAVEVKMRLIREPYEAHQVGMGL